MTIQLHPLISKFIQFAMAGGVGTAVQYVILILLVNHLDINAVLASSIGFLFGALVNYNLSYFWVFKSYKSHKETSVKFLITASLGFLLNFFFDVFPLSKCLNFITCFRK